MELKGKTVDGTANNKLMEKNREVMGSSVIELCF